MKNVDDIYTSIGQNILDSTDNLWENSEVIANVYDGAVELKGGSQYKGQFTSFKFRNFDRRIISDFQELHKITTEDSDNKWNRAKFTLESTGDFNIEFEWDQELADEIEQLNSE